MINHHFVEFLREGVPRVRLKECMNNKSNNHKG